MTKDDLDRRLSRASLRRRDYLDTGDTRSAEIELGVINRLLDERLVLKREC